MNVSTISMVVRTLVYLGIAGAVSAAMLMLAFLLEDYRLVIVPQSLKNLLIGTSVAGIIVDILLGVFVIVTLLL